MNFGIAYGIVLILSLIIVWFGSTQYTKPLFLFTDFLIALPAFFIKISPFIYWDTNRFSDLLNIIRSYNEGGIGSGLNWTLHYSIYSSQPLVAIYIWLFSLFRQDGVFFFATAFFFLISISLMLLKIMKYFNVNKNTAIIVQTIILMIFNLFYEIEGVRNFLSFGIFSTALFIDFHTKEKKWKVLCFFFYLIAYMFHPAVLLFIFFRIVLLLKNKLFFFIVALLSLIYTPFLNVLMPIFQKIGFEDKAQVYLYGQSNYNSFTSSAELIVTSLILISLIIELVLFTDFKLSEYLSKNYYRFYIIAILFTLGSFLSAQIYLRSIILILFLSAPIKSIMFSDLVNNGTSNYTIVNLYKIVTFLFAIFMFICWYDWTYCKVFL